MKDEQLIKLYFERSEKAIVETKKEYHTFCMSIALKLLKWEDSEEVVADTYLKVWNHIPPTYPYSFKSFIGKITRHLSIDYFRKNHREKRNEDLYIELNEELASVLKSSTNIESEVSAKIINEYISEFLSQQSKTKRIIFVRRYWYMDTIEEIAQRMNISENKCRMILFRLRKKLKEYLEKEGIIE